ncbi:hypothetical protein BDV12DRAFT_190754 [Aspergillus spectabilis]
MRLLNLVAAGLAPGMALALSRHAVECDFSTTADGSATCSSFASSWGISVDTLQQLNPGISCPNLDTSKLYCVIGTVTDDPEEPNTTLTITTCTTTSTTTTTSAAPSNSPTMPGIAENCDSFYKISSGDQCGTIAASHSITVDQLKSWNREINNDCTNLWLDYYICVHVPGATTTSQGSEPTPDPSQPTPQMPGVAESCVEFYKISSVDQCDTIASRHSITVNQLKSWNNEVNADCSNLWLDYYICVHVPGATTTQPSNPGPTEEPSGPTPQMPGIVDNCKSYHLIKSGDSCWSIYRDAGITLAQFRQWNTQVDASCSNLWLGYYVCIGV